MLIWTGMESVKPLWSLIPYMAQLIPRAPTVRKLAYENAGQQVTFSLVPGAPTGIRIDSESGVLKWTPACVQGGSSNIITVIATDDGCENVSSAGSFAAVVTECLQTSLGQAVGAAGGGATSQCRWSPALA